MNMKTFLRTCGASALVAAVSLAALSAPASAEERPEHRNRAERVDSSDRGNGRQQQWGAQRAQRQQAAPQRQQRAERTWSAPQRAERAEQRSGRDWNRGDNNAWGQARAAQARQAQAEAQERLRGQAESRQSTQNWGRPAERNRTYADTTRNRTYREGYREGRTADNRQDRTDTRNAYRSGYREGQRTEHSSDGRRWDGGRDGHRRYNGGDYRRWSNDWRRDNRYNWYNYRNANRSIYRLGAYYAPYRNYRYSRLSIGFYLDSVFFGSRYWINDPWQYRLPPAYGPYRWVRYYDDALLVDIYSGEVVDVIYDFFW